MAKRNPSSKAAPADDGKKSAKKLNAHHNKMDPSYYIPPGVDIHDNRVSTVRMADLRPKDRFQLDGETCVLNAIHGDSATVTRMATRSNVTGHKAGKPVITEYEYGARILELPLNTEIG
jgi:high-affinity K+ transport system ATPase subunit B